MALNPALAQDADFRLVCVAPDVCFTPSKPYAPTPYPIVHTLDKSKKVSKNVFINGKPVYLHKLSYVDNVQGDEPGMGKGLVSQTNTKISHNIGKSSTVFVNGHPIVRAGDAAWMNWSKK
jgi:uncharacterized Zn-binding protein involved in type VI secretion